MKKVYFNILIKIDKILQKELGKIILISFSSYLGYGINRYFYGKYFNLFFVIKLSKFLIGYLNHFWLWFFIYFLFSFLPKTLKKIMISIILVIFISLTIIEVLLLFNFKSIINNSILQILFESNINEGFEFFKSYISMKNISYILVIIILFYLISKIKINLKNNIIKILILVFSFINFINFNKIINDTPIIRLYNSIRVSLKNIKVYKELNKNLKNDIIIKDEGKNIENIILIIGESTSKNHMSIYNYKYHTTPLLEKREKNQMYKFNDVISPHAHTIPVLQKLLTFYNAESENEWYKYNNIVDIMKANNYKTYWFSNQEAFGVFGNVAAAIGNRSDIVVFNRIRDSYEEGINSYDEEIVEKSKLYIDKDCKKNFIVYHLLGTHTNYKYRYPEKFSYFKEENYSANKENKKIISEYDNAILYNDFVVDKIVKLYENKESIIFYLSDHGEEVFEFRDFMGHSEENLSRYMAEIPFIIFTTEKFEKKYPAIKNQLENSVNRPYMTDDFIHTLLDIGGIRTNEYDETRSIISNKFNKERIRIFGGKNYETYWKNKD